MAGEERWMLEALRVARHGEGMTRPNPPVGAVIVKDGARLAEGFHLRSGELHAEVDALNKAGDAADGADIYVTLEPCSTYGKTPPCTDAIISAGIRRAIIAIDDPNPHHAGRGLEILRRNGIKVELGLCREEARNLLEPFTKWILHRRPWMTLKLGMSLDGRIADRNGESKWITGGEARGEVQALRRRADAVMVGSGTALADDPSLLPRPDDGRRPYRILLDEAGRLPADLRVFTDDMREQTIVATTEVSNAEWRERIAARGSTVWVLPNSGGHVALPALMERIGELGLLHVLCEGGGKLAGELIEQGLVDDYLFFLAPCLFGAEGKPSIGGSGWLMSELKKLDILETRRCGEDIMVSARDM